MHNESSLPRQNRQMQQVDRPLLWFLCTNTLDTPHLPTAILIDDAYSSTPTADAGPNPAMVLPALPPELFSHVEYCQPARIGLFQFSPG